MEAPILLGGFSVFREWIHELNLISLLAGL
jgi:hypothetical protein